MLVGVSEDLARGTAQAYHTNINHLALAPHRAAAEREGSAAPEPASPAPATATPGQLRAQAGLAQALAQYIIQ